jgi:hypothetical protein
MPSAKTQVMVLATSGDALVQSLLSGGAIEKKIIC